MKKSSAARSPSLPRFHEGLPSRDQDGRGWARMHAMTPVVRGSSLAAYDGIRLG